MVYLAILCLPILVFILITNHIIIGLLEELLKEDN